MEKIYDVSILSHGGELYFFLFQVRNQHYALCISPTELEFTTGGWVASDVDQNSWMGLFKIQIPWHHFRPTK